MKLSSIKINGRAIEEGAWVNQIPQLPGVRLKVRGLGNRDYRRFEAKLIREIPREARIDGLDPADADAIEARCLAETVLIDWDGIEGDDGAPQRLTPEIALGYLQDPDYLVLRNAVVYAASIVASTKAADETADAGN